MGPPPQPRARGRPQQPQQPRPQPHWSGSPKNNRDAQPPRPCKSLCADTKSQAEAAAVVQLEAKLQELRRLPVEESRRGIKELMVQWHPDKNQSRDEATRVFQWLQNRREELFGR